MKIRLQVAVARRARQDTLLEDTDQRPAYQVERLVLRQLAPMVQVVTAIFPLSHRSPLLLDGHA